MKKYKRFIEPSTIILLSIIIGTWGPQFVIDIAPQNLDFWVYVGRAATVTGISIGLCVVGFFLLAKNLLSKMVVYDNKIEGKQNG